MQKGRQKKEKGQVKKEVIKRWLCVWGRGAGRRPTLWCLFHDGCTFSRKDQENSNKDREARSMQYRTRTESNKQENERTHTQQQKQVMRISFREFGPPLSASQLISLCVRATLLFFSTSLHQRKRIRASSHRRTCPPPFVTVACFHIAQATPGGLYLQDSTWHIKSVFTFPGTSLIARIHTDLLLVWSTAQRE